MLQGPGKIKQERDRVPAQHFQRSSGRTARIPGGSPTSMPLSFFSLKVLSFAFNSNHLYRGKELYAGQATMGASRDARTCKAASEGQAHFTGKEADALGVCPTSPRIAWNPSLRSQTLWTSNKYTGTIQVNCEALVLHRSICLKHKARVILTTRF